MEQIVKIDKHGNIQKYKKKRFRKHRNSKTKMFRKETRNGMKTSREAELDFIFKGARIMKAGGSKPLLTRGKDYTLRNDVNPNYDKRCHIAHKESR